VLSSRYCKVVFVSFSLLFFVQTSSIFSTEASPTNWSTRPSKQLVCRLTQPYIFVPEIKTMKGTWLGSIILDADPTGRWWIPSILPSFFSPPCLGYIIWTTRSGPMIFFKWKFTMLFIILIAQMKILAVLGKVLVVLNTSLPLFIALELQLHVLLTFHLHQTTSCHVFSLSLEHSLLLWSFTWTTPHPPGFKIALFSYKSFQFHKGFGFFLGSETWSMQTLIWV
jgi:hypothetical protein